MAENDTTTEGNSLPPMNESTSQAIAAALLHQYGIPCAFVVCVMPVDDVEMIAQTPAGEMPKRAPRAAVNATGLTDEIGAQLMANVLEAYRRKVTPGDPIGEPQGKA